MFFTSTRNIITVLSKRNRLYLTFLFQSIWYGLTDLGVRWFVYRLAPYDRYVPFQVFCAISPALTSTNPMAYIKKESDTGQAQTYPNDALHSITTRALIS